MEQGDERFQLGKYGLLFQMIRPFREFSSWTRLQSSPFFLSQPANDAGAWEGTGVRCAAVRDWRKGRASRTSRLPRTRVVRWLGKKKGTVIQSTVG